MPVFHERMPAGIPGDVSRKAGAVLEPVFLAEDIPYGAPVQLNAVGRLTLATDSARPVYGFLTRPFPAQSGFAADDALGAGTAKSGAVGDVLRSGYLTVKLSGAEGASPVKGAAVKVVFAATGGFAAGDIATSAGTAVPACTFMGDADAGKNTEIAFNV